MRRTTTREAFESWILRNHPATSLQYKECGEYALKWVQESWLSFAAGWAHRGQFE